MTRVFVCALFGLFISIAGYSESGDASGESGCILGYDTKGVAVLSLIDGEKRILSRRKENRFPISPAIDQRRSTLYYSDEASTTIVQRRLGNNGLRAVYRVPPNYAVKWLILDSTGDYLLFSPYRPGYPQSRIVEYNIPSGKIRHIEAPVFFYPFQRPYWIDRDTLAVLTFAKEGDISLKFTLQSLDTTSGDLVPLLGHAGYFALSDSKERLLVNDTKGDYILYAFPTLKVLGKIPQNVMPGKNDVTSPFCFVDDNKIVFWRWRDRKTGLGTFLLDLRTFKYELISTHMLWGMSYLRGCPAHKRDSSE